MAKFADSKIEAFAGPGELGASDNLENVFVIGSPFDLPADKGGPVDHGKCAEIAAFFRGAINQIVAKSDLYE